MIKTVMCWKPDTGKMLRNFFKFATTATVGVLFFADDTFAGMTDGRMSYDLVIYGGSSAGIAAAVQAKRMGIKAVVIEPTFRIGGLTTGGLGQTDIGGEGRCFVVDEDSAGGVGGDAWFDLVHAGCPFQ